MKNNQKKINKLFFAVFALYLIVAVGMVPASADTSVAWTKEIGDVLAADMAEDGSIVYAAIADGADSTLYVYDSQGTEQNTFNISGAVQEIVCTADGSKAALYTDGNEVYYLNNGEITWTEEFAAITDIDISNIGSVLIVESNIFHKYLSDGTIDYNSASGTFDLGVIDPNDDFTLVQSGNNILNKYIVSTTNDYWGKVNENIFNTNFSDYQNVLILYLNSTSAIILNNQTLGDELWDEIFTNLGSENQYYAVSNSSLIQTDAYKYLVSKGWGWNEVTSSAAWSARFQACAWVFNDRMWIGGGKTGSTRVNDVWYSTDGVVWTRATASAGWTARSGACAWVFNDCMWIGGGISTSDQLLRDVWYSTDGAVWTQATATASWSGRYGACAWVFNDLMWIGGGRSGSVILNDVWSSSDGTTWTRATASAAWSARYQACAWVFNDRMWIGGGSSNNQNVNDIWSSSDGTTWTRATASAGWTARSGACAWVFDDRMWIGGGYSINQHVNDVWSSSDGITWAQVIESADGTARQQACAWVFDDRMWMGSGYTGVFYNDVWVLSEGERLKIKPSSIGQTWLFYNYQGSNPQYTPISYKNAVNFTGTTELKVKPTLSIYSYQTSKTYSEAIVDLSLSDAGDWVGVATASKIYADQITSEGFGTSYNGYLGSEGTVYDIATANGAAMSVIGQGQYTDIFSQIAARVGTYTAGGDIHHVDIAGNALWATSGGSDGKMYLFSKDQSSNWYLEYSSESGNPITALKMATSGSYILAGRTDGLTFYQQTSPSPQPSGSEFWFTLYTYKDSDSYRNAAVNVSVYSGNQWSGFAQGVTDSTGKFVVQLTAGQTYKFDVGNGQKMLVYMATPSVTSQTISIYTSPVSSALTYDAVWDTDIGGISFDYRDSSGQTQSVNVKIQRTDTWETVYDQTFTGQQDIEENLPIIDDTTTYKVELSASRSTGVTRNIFFVSSSRDIVPIPLDQNIKNVLFSGLLMVIAGLFSYLSAIRGAVVVGFAAMFFVYLGWLTIPWHWAIIAVVIAIVAGFTQRRT